MPKNMAYSVTWAALILFSVVLQSKQQDSGLKQSKWSNNYNMNYNENNFVLPYRTGINNIIIRKPVIHFYHSEALVPWRGYFYTSGKFEFFRDLKIKPQSPLYYTLKTIEAYTGRTMTDLYNRFYKLFLEWTRLRNIISQQNNVLSSPELLQNIVNILFPELPIDFEINSSTFDWKKTYKMILNGIFPQWPHDQIEVLFLNANSPEDVIKEVFHQIISSQISFPVRKTETLSEVCAKAYQLLLTHLPSGLYQVFNWQNLSETFEKFLALIYGGTPNFFEDSKGEINPDMFNLLIKFVEGLKAGKAEIPSDLMFYFLVHPHIKLYVNTLFRTTIQSDEEISENNVVQLLEYILDSNIYNIPDTEIPIEVKMLLKYIRKQPSNILIEKGLITSDAFLSFVDVMKDLQRRTLIWDKVPENLIQFFAKHRNMKAIIEMLFESPPVIKYTIGMKFNVVYSLFDLLVHKHVTNLTPETLQFIISLPNHENIFSSTIYSNISPELLLELIQFLETIEDNNISQQNIPHNLLKLIIQMPNFDKILKEIYASKLTISLKHNVRINLLEEFILFLVKREQNLATLSDITPNVLEMIEKQPNPDKLTPSLPDGLNVHLLIELIHFLNDIDSHSLNWETVPQDLIQYFLTARNLENTFQILFKSPVTSKIHLDPNTVTKFVFYLEKRNTQQLTPNDLPEDVLQLILQFKNSKDLLPFEITQGVNSTIITQMIEFITDVYTKQLDVETISDELLFFFENYPNLDLLLEQILKSELFANKNIDKNILLQFMKVLNKIKHNSLTSLDMSQNLLQFSLSFPKLQRTITNLVFGQNVPSSLVPLLIEFLTKVQTKQVDLNNIPQNLIEFLSTTENLNQMIANIMNSTLISYHDVSTTIVIQLIEMIKNHKTYNDIRLSSLSIDLIKYLSQLSTKFAFKDVTPKQLLLLIEFINKVNLKTQRLMEISDDLSDFFLSYSHLEQLLEDLYGAPYILKSTPSSTMIMLIKLLNDLKVHATSQIPITVELQALLNQLPDGKIVLSKIEPVPSTTIASSIRHADFTSGKTPQIIQEELYKFIINVNNNQINEISPELLQFISLHSDLERIIQELITTEHITIYNINPHLLAQLLFFIKDTQKHSTPVEVPESLVKILINMDGADELTKTALDWFSVHAQDKMMQLFLEIIKQNGGTKIPEQLRAWIMTLSNGEQVLKFLEAPGEIECTQTSYDAISCKKTNIVRSYSSSFSSSEDILPELIEFVDNVIKHKVDIDHIPSHLLRFILTTSDLEDVLPKLLNSYLQLHANINIQDLVEFIEIVKMYLNGEQIIYIPDSILELILLQDSSRKLVDMALNWKLQQSQGQSSDMIQLFLKLIRENDGKFLPPSVENWINTLPNGKMILQILQMPGDIKCTEEKSKVTCVKETKHIVDKSF